jgi:hypothetical protein
VDSQVKTHEFNETLVVAKAEQSRQVVRVVLLKVDSRQLAIAKDVAVDAASNVRQLGNPEPKLITDKSHTGGPLTDPSSPQR